MTFAIYESIKMNTTTTSIGMGTPIPQKEPIQAYHISLVIPEAPDGATREEAIQHLFMAGCHLQDGQDIRPEAEWPEEVRRQVDSRHFDPNSSRSWADFPPKR
jgi:hypothetical protein